MVQAVPFSCSDGSSGERVVSVSWRASTVLVLLPLRFLRICRSNS